MTETWTEIKKTQGWGHPRNSPAKPWMQLIEGSHGAYVVEHRPWLDHLYRLKIDDGEINKVVFVAEPYWINDDAFDDFIMLRELGWQVVIGSLNIPDALRHHDTTTVVTFTR